MSDSEIVKITLNRKSEKVKKLTLVAFPDSVRDDLTVQTIMTSLSWP